MQSRIRLPGLEATRFYAAAAIVLFHFVRLSQVEVPPFLNFIGTQFGRGVPLFFVVSAFGLTLGYHKHLGTRDALKDFYLRRLFRIAPLFYFMMLLNIPYRQFIWGTPPSFAQFVSSGLFIFNFIPQHAEGFVAASWSIGVEMAFYLILPLLLFAITNRNRALAFLALSVFVEIFWLRAFAAAPPMLGRFGELFLISHLHCFASGILAYFVWAELVDKEMRVRGELLIVGSLVSILGLYSGYFDMAIGSLVGPGNGPAIVVLSKAAWALALATFVIGIAISPVTYLVNDATLALGRASFSIYLWHPLVIRILIQTGVYEGIYAVAGSGLPAFLLCAVLTFLIVCPLALVSYRFIEAPGMGLIRHFRKGPVQSPPAPDPVGSAAASAPPT